MSKYENEDSQSHPNPFSSIQPGGRFPVLSAVFYVRQLNQEGEVTLPIGKKQTTSKEARKYLEDMGNAYGADTSYVLYMADDDWGEENHFRLFLIRFGASAGV